MNAYQKEQAEKAVNAIRKAYKVGHLKFDLLDVALADLHEPFECWDNIATDIYTNNGHTLTDNYPDDESAFEDAQNEASTLIVRVYNGAL